MPDQMGQSVSRPWLVVSYYDDDVVDGPILEGRFATEDEAKAAVPKVQEFRADQTFGPTVKVEHIEKYRRRL